MTDTTEPTSLLHRLAPPRDLRGPLVAILIFIAAGAVFLVWCANRIESNRATTLSAIEDTYGATLVSDATDLPHLGEAATLVFDLPSGGKAQCVITMGDHRGDVTLLCGPTLTEPARR